MGRCRNPKGTPANLTAPRFGEPGSSNNPGGKPVGARNRLQGKFLNALADDFDEHGVAAIRAMRIADPSGYVKAIASLMPKEIEVSRPLGEMTDDELTTAIAAVQAAISASPEPRAAAAAGRKQAKDVPTLQ